MNRYDFKNIIKRIIVGVAIAFLVMSIKQCNVSALVSKGYDSNNPFVDRNKTGSISNTNLNEVRFTFQTKIDTNLYTVYDLFGFKMEKKNIYKDLNVSIASSGAYCDTYRIDHYYPCGNDPAQCILYQQMVCTSSYTQTNGTTNIIDGDITLAPYIINDDGGYVGCWFSSEVEDYILCPIEPNHLYKQLLIEISYYGFDSIKYDFFIGNRKTIFNYDSTEIVNGLSGVQQEQHQTNSIISDSNISGANTSTNNAISGIENSVDSTLNSAISPNQLYTILTSFTNQLSTSTCSPITLPIPYTNESIILPCLGTEFSQRIPLLWALYELIITGVIVLRFWQHGVEFVLNVLDPYHIGANNIPTGGGK